MTPSGPKYLPILLAVLCICSLAAACTLDVTSATHAGQAWTAFIAFSAALLGVHIPAPAAGPGAG